MTKNSRMLNEQERNALKKILSADFRDHEKLKTQVDGLSLRQIDDTLFELAPCEFLMASSEKNIRKFGVPVDCTYTDEDNEVVYVDLFVDKDDALVELEIWKPDGSTVQTYFADAALTVKLQKNS